MERTLKRSIRATCFLAIVFLIVREGGDSVAPAEHSRTPLVFIHGIKGSVLVDRQANVRWLSWWQALGLDTPDLRLPLRWDAQGQQRDGLTAQEPLRSVAWQDIYAPFLSWASASGRPFHAFTYDWRRDNLESADKFIRFLEKVSRENNGAAVQVVAHSMGGLITFVALNRRPELFHSALFAGVPFGSTISFLEDMHAGTANGLNKRILSPQVLFTFASPYSFFPANPNNSGLVEVTGERILHDWYEPDSWIRMKLGVVADSSRVTAEQGEHLRRALGRAAEFRNLISYSRTESFQCPPIAVLASDAHPTPSTVIRDGPRSVKGWDFRTTPKEPGDGRVLFSNAMPPAGVPYSVWKTPFGHSKLLDDTKQLEAILVQLGRP